MKLSATRLALILVLAGLTGILVLTLVLVVSLGSLPGLE